MVEFSLSGQPLTPADWAYGLADLLSIELQKRKLPLIERSDVRLLLAERLLSVPGGGAVSDLPQVRFLVTGSIRKAEANQFHISASLTDAQTARERVSASASGVFPSDVPRAVERVAEAFASELKKDYSGPSFTVPPIAPAFSRTPEVTWLFYRGVEHSLEGDPESAVVYFIEAHRADKLFVAAKLWKWRAFELLGIEEFTELARRELEMTPLGVEALAFARQGTVRAPGRTVIALVSGGKMPMEGVEALASFRRLLESSGTCELFEPERISALASEMDLQLTARFGEAAELTRFQWSAVDGLIGFQWLGAAGSGTPRFRAMYAPSLAAAPVITETGEATPEGYRAAANRLLSASAARSEIASDLKLSNGTAVLGWVESRDGPPRTRENLARVLRHLRQRPSDRAAWQALMWFRDWMDGEYASVVQRRLASLVGAPARRDQDGPAHAPVPARVTNAAPMACSAELESLEKRFDAMLAVAPQQAPSAWLVLVREVVELKRTHPAIFRAPPDSLESLKAARVVRLSRGELHGSFTPTEKLITEASAALNRVLWSTLVEEQRTSLRELGIQLSADCHPTMAARCLEAVGQYERARLTLEELLAQVESELSRAQMRANAQRSPEEFRRIQSLKIQRPEILREIARLWGAAGHPLAAAEFLRTNLDRFTGPEKLALAREAAKAFFAAGRPERACDLFRSLSMEPWQSNAFENLGATVRFRWAEFEIRRGALFEAAEILREVIAESDGKTWSLNSSSSGTLLLKDNALAALKLTRLLAGVQVASHDWEPVDYSRRWFLPIVELPEMPGAAALELRPLLLEQCFAVPGISMNFSGVGSWLQRHGRAALPCVLHVLRSGFLKAPEMLDALAQPQDTALVLSQFNKNPELAITAFRLDPAGAAQATRERFGAYANDRLIPTQLLGCIERHRLTDQYPVIIANLMGKAWNVHVDLIRFERMVQKDPEPELITSFKELLAYRLELHLATGRDYALDELSMMAVRWGVPQGIEALLRIPRGQNTNVLSFLRGHVKLPEGEQQAWELLRAKRGLWQWNTSSRRFE